MMEHTWDELVDGPHAAVDVTVRAAGWDTALPPHTAGSSGQAVGLERELVLGCGRGQAILRFKTYAPWLGEGTGELSPPDRAQGSSFVDAVSEVLEVEMDEPPPGRLAPVPFRFVTDEDREGWQILKIMFSGAEVFLGLEPSLTRGVLIAPDEDEELIALCSALAHALRDGTPPRRTSADDPLFASESGPLLQNVTFVPGGDGVEWGAWVGERFAGARENQLLVWERLEAPPRKLAPLNGPIEAVIPRPGYPEAAVLVLGTEPEVLVISVESGQPRPLATASPFKLDDDAVVVWSPDGGRLAVQGLREPPPRAGRRPPHVDPSGLRVTRIYDGDTGAILGETETEGLPLSFDGEELIFEMTTGDIDLDRPPTYQRWFPGGALLSTLPPPSRMTSPDGRYSIEDALDGAIVVHGPTGVRRELRHADLEDGLLYHPGIEWVGPAMRAADLPRGTWGWTSTRCVSVTSSPRRKAPCWCSWR
jgi:hypothetical protein